MNKVLRAFLSPKLTHGATTWGYEWLGRCCGDWGSEIPRSGSEMFGLRIGLGKWVRIFSFRFGSVVITGSS